MTASHRGVYRHKELDRLFNPKSVAVVGVSPNASSFGSSAVSNLIRNNYPGRVYRINPKYDKIGEDVCYPSVSALPEVPDAAIIALPRAAVEAAVRECAKAGVGGVVIFASGYFETGLPGRGEEQDQLVAIARDSGLKIIGPNCMGFASHPAQAMVSFATHDMELAPPPYPGIAVLSQSGAMGFSLSQAVRRGMNISHVVASGNACDVNVNDCISYFADEPSCGAIAVLFEGMNDPQQLLDAGEIAWQAGKPVVICKLGIGEGGAAAAMSHTGSLAGSTAAYKAAFDRAGMVVVPSIERLLETAAFLCKVSKPPASRGIAAMGGSGGSLIAATDSAELNGLDMPPLTKELEEKLRPYVPEFGALRNPCDLTAMVAANPSAFPAAIETMLADEQYSAMVVPQLSVKVTTRGRLQSIAGTGIKLGKPICLPFIGGWVGGPGNEFAEMERGLQWFFSMDSCMATIKLWHERDDKRRERKTNGPRKLSRVSPADAREKAASLIAASKNQALTEREAKEVLAAYGVPVVGEKLVKSSEEAMAAARSLGMPVAIKVESPDLPHKTEAGVIRLNLKTEAEVKAAYDAVMANARKYKADAKLNGVLVQPMVPAGTEIMVGAKIDPLFGPLIVTGLGGILVELLKDTSLDLAPVTHAEARSMLARLKGKAALAGFRGSEPVHLDKLAEIIVRLSEFADDQKDLIAELDVNPLICSGGRVMAVDALIVRKAIGRAEARPKH
jgi:acyl-CoA synthetase (NDP forming)